VRSMCTILEIREPPTPAQTEKRSHPRHEAG
jgi:hypothetical protein